METNLLSLFVGLIIGLVGGYVYRGQIIHKRHKIAEQVRMIKRVTLRIEELISEGDITRATLKLQKFALICLSCEAESFKRFTKNHFQEIGGIISEYVDEHHQYVPLPENVDGPSMIYQPSQNPKPVDYYQKKIYTILITFFKLEK